MTAPTINDIRAQVRALFPNARVLFATDGTRVIGNPVDDDPQPIPFALAPDCVADRHSVRARQEAMNTMRKSLTGATT
jgi:hypothetical protein